jgi:hypothetical protein
MAEHENEPSQRKEALLVRGSEPVEEEDDDLVDGGDEDVETVEAVERLGSLAVQAYENHGRRLVELEDKKLEAARIVSADRPAQRTHEQELTKLRSENDKMRGEQSLAAMKLNAGTKIYTLYLGAALAATVMGLLGYALHLVDCLISLST